MPTRSVGTEFTVNSTLEGDQAYPEIHWLYGGRFIATWQSDDLWSHEWPWDPYVVRARIFEPDGTADGADFVFVKADWDAGITSIEPLESGGFLAQWSVGDWEITGIEVSARTYDREGHPAGDAFQLPFYFDNSLTRLSDGRFVSAGLNSGDLDSDIRAIFLDEKAQPLGEDFQVNALDTGWERTPMSTALPDGRFFMAWQSDNAIWDDPPIPGGASVMGRLFNADGSPAGEDFRINSTPTNTQYSLPNSLDTLSDGTVLATWWSYTDENSYDPTYLLGQRIDATGTPIGGEVVLEDWTGYPADRSRTHLTELADGRTLATWGFWDQQNPVLHARLQDEDWTAISDEFTIAAPYGSSVDALGDGRIAVSWSTGQYDPDTGSYLEGDIRARIFNPKIFDGTPGDDFWTGGAFNDRLFGGDGNDRLRGMAGDDRLHGGNGDDFLDGSEGDDFIWGDAGNDILAGWTGTDTMTGGTGNDIYVVDRPDDLVVENAGEGIDTVQSYISLRLSANVEHLVLKGRGDTAGSGNALANSIVGNSGDNLLRGGGGPDRPQEAVQIDPLTGQPGSGHRGRVGEALRVDGPWVGGQFGEIRQLPCRDRSDQVLAVQGAGRVDGVCAYRLVQRHGLVWCVHRAGTGPPSDRGGDVEDR